MNLKKIFLSLRKTAFVGALIFSCAALVSLISACASGEGGVEGAGQPDKNSELVMGVILPLSGAQGEAAANVLRGMNLARDEINARGGVGGRKIRLLVSDAAAADFSIFEAVDKMKDAGAKYFHIGFTNEMAFPIKRLAADEEIFINCVSEYPPATLAGKNAVRIFANGAQTGDEISKFVKRPEGEEVKYASMKVSDLFGKSCGDYLAFNMKLERTKFFADVFTNGEKRFDIFAEQILRIAPLCVFYTGYGSELSAFCDSLYKGGYSGMIVANTPLLETGVLHSSKSATLYVVRTLFETGGVNTEESRAFKAAYAKAYGGARAPWTAAYGYDGVELLARAAEATNFTPKKMREFFENKTFDCVVGKLKFDASGDSVSEVGVFREQ